MNPGLQRQEAEPRPTAEIDHQDQAALPTPVESQEPTLPNKQRGLVAVRRVFEGVQDLASDVQHGVLNKKERFRFRGLINEVVKEFEAELLKRAQTYSYNEWHKPFDIKKERNGTIKIGYGNGIELEEAERMQRFINGAIRDPQQGDMRDIDMSEQFVRYSRNEAGQTIGELRTYPTLGVFSKDELMSSELITKAITAKLIDLADNPDNKKPRVTEGNVNPDNLKRAVINKLYPKYLQYMSAIKQAVDERFAEQARIDRSLGREAKPLHPVSQAMVDKLDPSRVEQRKKKRNKK